MNRTFLNTENFFKRETSLKVWAVKIDMDRIRAVGCRSVQSIRPDSRQAATSRRALVDFKNGLITAYPELQTTAHVEKSYWCPVTKWWTPVKEVRAALLVPIWLAVSLDSQTRATTTFRAPERCCTLMKLSRRPLIKARQ